jgi:hypothetical protein
MNKQNKEDFCPACLVAIPMAFTGMGAAGYSNSKLSSSSKKKKSRNSLFMIGIIGIILMLLSYPVWKKMSRGCSSCSV